MANPQLVGKGDKPGTSGWMLGVKTSGKSVHKLARAPFGEQIRREMVGLWASRNSYFASSANSRSLQGSFVPLEFS